MPLGLHKEKTLLVPGSWPSLRYKLDTKWFSLSQLGHGRARARVCGNSARSADAQSWLKLLNSPADSFQLLLDL